QRISRALSSNSTAPAGSVTSNIIALHLRPALDCRSECGIRSRSALKCTVRGLVWPSAQIIHAKHGISQVPYVILAILEEALVGKSNKRPGKQIKRATRLDSRRDSSDLPAAASRSPVPGAAAASGIP